MSALDEQIGGDHYKRFKIQPVTFCMVNNIPFAEGNIIKYVVRHSFKNGAQDLDKAIHMLRLLKEETYGLTRELVGKSDPFQKYKSQINPVD
jgi:hypothetical protein